MKCVILAAGRGTRMGDLCADCPKPMLPIKGRPKLAYTIETLPEAVDEVVLVVGYLQERIRAYFGDVYEGRAITYVEQIDLHGTEHALRQAAPLLDGQRFLVLNGDDLYRKDDLAQMLQHEYAVLAYHTKQAQEFGYVETYDDGSLRAIIEKPHAYAEGPVSTGTFVLDSEYFNFPPVAKSPGSDEFGLPQTLVAAHPEIVVQVVHTDMWFPIGDVDQLDAAQEVIDDFIDDQKALVL